MIWFVLQIIMFNLYLFGTGNGRRYKTGVNIHAELTQARVAVLNKDSENLSATSNQWLRTGM